MLRLAKWSLILLCMQQSTSAFACGEVATDQALVLPADTNFSLSLHDHIEELSEDQNAAASAETINSSRFVDQFTRLRLSKTFISDRVKWLRVRLCNPSATDIKTVLSTHYFFTTLHLVQVSPGMSHPTSANIGYGSQSEDRKPVMFLAQDLTLPPGETVLYLGANSDKAPSQLEFELRPARSFDTYAQRFVAISAAVLVVSFTLTLFNSILLFGMPSAVHVYFIVTCLGIILMETCVSGAIGLLGGAMLVTNWRLWQVSLAIAFYAGGMFLIRFFNVDVGRHKSLLATHYVGTAISATAIVLSPWAWKYGLEVVAISLAFLTWVFIKASTLQFAERRLRVLLAWACIAPVVVFGFVVIFDFYVSKGSTDILLYFGAASLISLTVMSLFTTMELGRLERQSRAMSASLQSVFPPFQLHQIVSKGLALDQTPQERYVSVMFIDIVGYTAASRGRVQTDSFRFLKETLSFIGKIVHQHGGIIDKSLGDGCLCFFGYDLAGNEGVGHERTAVKCALEIQRRMVDRINGLAPEDKDVFPLRIGVNTAMVCIGNMGDEYRYDFTLHGEGVNMAKRFESACEPFKVTIGKSTYDALDEQARNGERFYLRLVPIKNASSLIEAYEVNPFEKESVSLERARTRYWQSIGVQRVDQRFAPTATTMAIKTQYGDMVVQNFSLNGFCVKTSIFLGKGAELTLDFSEHMDTKAAPFLGLVTVQVRWGVPSQDDQFILGTLISGLSEKHRELLFAALMRAAERQLALTA